MKVLDGDVNIHSDVFKANLKAMHQINTDLDSKMHVIMQGGGEVANKRHQDRGKLLGRSQIIVYSSTKRFSPKISE